MDKIFYLFLFYVILTFHFITNIYAGRVHELTDIFPKVRESRLDHWLVKFYAPWCGHCKRLEPIWKQVAQSLADTRIIVGRLDVTRYPTVATTFGTTSMPTIKFITPDAEHTYHGDRSREAIAEYARRMSAPAVQEITQADNIEKLRKNNVIFFMYVGEKKGKLWEMYIEVAIRMQPYVSFFLSNELIAKQHTDIPEVLPAIYVHKENQFYSYPIDANEPLEEDFNNTLSKWVTIERFQSFPKITVHTINEYLQTKKYLVLVIVEENKIKEIPGHMLEFRNKVETLIRKKRDRYHKRFQFGWMSDIQLANSIAMTRLQLPYLLVLNSSTYHHHVPEDDPPRMTIEAIETFLEMIMNSTSPVYGGRSVHVNAIRKILDLIRNLEDMWKANPLVMIIIFSLPTIFFLIILYSCCCADILDAPDDEDEELIHEKRE